MRNIKEEDKEPTLPFFHTLFSTGKSVLENNGMGLVYLMQPMMLSVASMVESQKGKLLEENHYEQAYLVSKKALIFFVKEAPVKIAMFGRDMSYIAGSKLWLKDPISSESSKWQKIHDDCLQGISQKSEEDSWPLPDGRQKWLRWEAQPWYLGADKIGGSLIFCEDVTKRKEIQIRADHLTKINDELENFAYMCPHDLQTHIRTLSSFVTLMEEHNHNKMDELTRTYISYIKVAIDGMKSIIQNFLLYNELINHSFLKEHVNMNELLKNVLMSIDSSIKQRKAIIQATNLPPVFASKVCIKRVFENLILNSIKFCTKQPVIEIQGKEEQGYVTFSIKDNGVGIPPQDQKKVFNKFSRLHSSQKFPGTGLGLSYCKKVMEYHEGKIWIESAGDDGSIFHVSLPKLKHAQEKQPSLPNS